VLELLLSRYLQVNLFRYITFRGAGAAITSFLFTILLAPVWIRMLRDAKVGEDTQATDSPEVAAARSDRIGTPTMGGILILAGTIIGSVFWAKVGNPFVACALLTILCLGGLGFVDDYYKYARKGGGGLSKRAKLVVQSLLALCVGVVLMRLMQSLKVDYLPAGVDGGGMRGTELTVPFFKNFHLPLGILFVPMTMLVIVGASNAVNLTDGADGLAAGCSVMAVVALAVIAYVVGHKHWAPYLFVFRVPGAEELSVFCAALAGGVLGFLWYNCYPAQVFMGDTGALAIGGAIGYVAVATKHELTLVIIGSVFVAEALSVLLQVGYFKLTGGKRIFRVSPLHHHYEVGGMHEVKVVVRMVIVSALCAIFGIATLKLR